MCEDVKTPEELLVFMDRLDWGWISKKDDSIKKGHRDWVEEYFLQSPKQLLVSKQGTCWDQVELERD